jgi:hypothetical protein
MQNLMAPPQGTMYSLGGYAPADPNANNTGNPNLIDKSEVPSPVGDCGCNGGCNSCGGLWDGYLARPCHHRHHWGQGCGWHRKGWGGSSCDCNGGCDAGNQVLPCNTGCNTGCCGGGWGTGYGYAGAAYFSPGCGIAPGCGCRPHHCCKLVHCWKRACGCEVASCGDSCGTSCGSGCGATDSSAPEGGAPEAPTPAPAPELNAPTPPAPGPSAGRPRVWRSMAAMGGLLNN